MPNGPLRNLAATMADAFVNAFFFGMFALVTLFYVWLSLTMMSPVLLQLCCVVFLNNTGPYKLFCLYGFVTSAFYKVLFPM